MKNKKNKKTKLTKHQILNSFCITILSFALVTGIVGFSILQDIINKSHLVGGIDGLEASNSTRIYDQKGKLITTLSGSSGVRENVSFDKIPQSVIDAFLAVEDSRFYKHNGFDLPRFVKSAINNLVSGGLNQGGSTLTMQLVDTALFQENDKNQQTSSQKIKQKVQEIFKSMEIESKLSKEKIMENYLNQINFGGAARGIQKGAQYYFGKNVEDLNLSESAFLAGVINAPQMFNPYNEANEDNTNNQQFYRQAVARRNKVLYLMKYHGYITDEEYRLAKSTELAFQLNGATNFDTNEFKSFVDYVISEVKEKTGENPYTTPMDIYTTMDRDAQKLSDSLSDGEGVVYPDERFQTGFSAVNNQTGAILALGAGRSYDGNRNRACVDTHQPGSIAKPIVDYAPAFEYLGYTTNQIVYDKKIPYGQGYLNNFDHLFRGPVTLKYALGHSLNTTAYTACKDTVEKIGLDKEVELMQDMGLDINKDNWSYSMSIGGGDFYTTPLQMAGAYSTLANKGTYIEPYAVEKIKFQDIRRSDYHHHSVTKKVFSEETAWLTSYMLEDVVEGNYQNLAEILRDDYTVYAKTGTSSYEKEAEQYGYPVGVAKDKWLAAYTNKFTVVTWAGYDGPVIGQDNYLDQQKLFANVEGQITNKLLDKLVHDDKNKDTAIKKPSGVVKVNQIRGTNTFSNYHSANTITSYINKKFLNKLDEVKDYDLPKPNDLTVYENNNQTLTIKMPPLSGNNDVTSFIDVYLNDQSIGTYNISDGEITIPISGEEGDEVTVRGYYQYTANNTTGKAISKTIKLKYGIPKEFTLGSQFLNCFSNNFQDSKKAVMEYLKTNYKPIYENKQFVIVSSDNPAIQPGQFDPSNSNINVGSQIQKGDTTYYISIGSNQNRSENEEEIENNQ